MTNGVADPISVELDKNCQTAYIQVYDAQGEYVTDIEAGNLDAGMHSIAWDGTDQYGTTVGDGSYTFSVMAVDADGNSVSTTLLHHW